MTKLLKTPIPKLGSAKPATGPKQTQKQGGSRNDSNLRIDTNDKYEVLGRTRGLGRRVDPKFGVLDHYPLRYMTRREIEKITKVSHGKETRLPNHIWNGHSVGGKFIEYNDEGLILHVHYAFQQGGKTRLAGSKLRCCRASQGIFRGPLFEYFYDIDQIHSTKEPEPSECVTIVEESELLQYRKVLGANHIFKGQEKGGPDIIKFLKRNGNVFDPETDIFVRFQKISTFKDENERIKCDKKLRVHGRPQDMWKERTKVGLIPESLCSEGNYKPPEDHGKEWFAGKPIGRTLNSKQSYAPLSQVLLY